MRRAFRSATDVPIGYLKSISITRNEMLPPLRTRVLAGFGNWTKIGREFLEILIAYGGLGRTEKVLEVGCGFGRIAMSLTTYLSPEARYDGFDVWPAAIEWCRTRIMSRYPNFHFQLADVRNDVYNPQGSVSAEAFVFPHLSDSFDFVFLTSVFTHLLPAAVENYLREIGRVLKPGGRRAITYYLLDADSVGLMESGRSEVDFPGDYGTFRVQDVTHPERAVAYDLGFIRDLYPRSGLAVIEPIHFGFWSGRSHFLSDQDLVMAVKPRAR